MNMRQPVGCYVTAEDHPGHVVRDNLTLRCTRSRSHSVRWRNVFVNMSC